MVVRSQLVVRQQFSIPLSLDWAIGLPLGAIARSTSVPSFPPP
ncbi:hypothetical protein [Zarconia navalis]|nr:hypothetical protein [Zarconia navalis]